MLTMNLISPPKFDKIAGGGPKVDDSSGEVTRLLMELKGRRPEAAPRLFDLLYRELRRLAQRHMVNERPEHTMQATALVHEAYIRLVDGHQDWRNRAHFFAIASSAMRRILVDHARAKRAAKRPGSQKQTNLEDIPLLSNEHYDDAIAIDLALKKLSKIDARQGRIVELRYFGGLTADETSEALGVSTITVQRDWAVAKAWLHGELAARAAVR
jgi:RNA polymerase sigma-70 factor, ECF subfamily